MMNLASAIDKKLPFTLQTASDKSTGAWSLKGTTTYRFDEVGIEIGFGANVQNAAILVPKRNAYEAIRGLLKLAQNAVGELNFREQSDDPCGSDQHPPNHHAVIRKRAAGHNLQFITM